MSNGVRVAYKRYQQTRNLAFPKADLARLKEVKIFLKRFKQSKF